MKRHKTICLGLAAMLLTSCGTAIERRSDSILPSPADDETYSVASPTEGLSDELSEQNTESRVSDSGVSSDSSLKDADEIEAAEAYAELSDEADTQAEPSYSVHFLCAGDNLIHDNIFNEALQEDGSYDFSEMYELAEPYVSAADIAVLNQESLVTDAFAAQSYPVFATPTEVGDAVCDIGFNVISMANNHVLDKGSEGLISSLDYWETKDVVCYGAPK